MIKEGMVRVDGIQLYYKMFGSGRPILVLHGGPGSSHNYLSPYLSDLADSYRVILFDQRGCGKSERLSDKKQYTIDNMVQDLEGLRNALNLKKINLMGHSWGGILAIAYTLKYQQNILHLILVGASASMMEMDDAIKKIRDKAPSEIIDMIKNEGPKVKDILFRGKTPQERYVSLMRSLLSQPLYNPSHLHLFEQSTQSVRNLSWEVRREMMGGGAIWLPIDGNLKNIDFRKRLAEIHVPTLVIGGRHDISLDHSETIHRGILSSKLIIFEDSGHSPFIEEREKFMVAVKDFLSQ
jgi:proline iminopeptidase